MPASALPEHLRHEKHWDWPWPFSKIPRAWTAFKWGEPRRVAGPKAAMVFSQPPKPIDPPGGWQLSRYPDGPWWAWYFAFTLKSGRHFRIGARWDNVDNYVEFPSIATRKYAGGDAQDTSTR